MTIAQQARRPAWQIYKGGSAGQFYPSLMPIVVVHCADDGQIWAATHRSVLMGQENVWREVFALPPEGDDVERPLMFDAVLWFRGGPWVFGPKHVYSYPGGVWERVGERPFELWFAHAIAPDGSLWVSCEHGLLYTDDAHTWHSVALPAPRVAVLALHCDDAGHVWATCQARGQAHLPPFCYHRGSETWTALPPPNNIRPFTYFTSIISDRNGGIWVGSGSTGGIHHWDGTSWTHYAKRRRSSVPGLPTNWVRGLSIDLADRVWATGSSLSVFENGEWREVVLLVATEQSGGLEIWVPSAPSTPLLSSAERLWFGTLDNQIGWIDTSTGPVAHTASHLYMTKEIRQHLGTT